MGAADPHDSRRLAALAAQLTPSRDLTSEAVENELRSVTEAAAAGVFGVPTFNLEGRHSWGLDALPMLRDALQGGAWFDGPAGNEAGEPREGVKRR